MKCVNKKVYNFAESQLEEQRYIQDHDDYIGQTAAGEPIEGQQPVPILGSDTVKLLVNGDSMEELFHDGDIVEYHPQPELENGEIGVFAVNGMLGRACKRAGIQRVTSHICPVINSWEVVFLPIYRQLKLTSISSGVFLKR